MLFNTRKSVVPVTIMLLFGLLVSSCGSAEPTLDIDAQKTGFAQTADVQATQTAQAQPTATATPEPSPTFTATPEVTPTTEETEANVSTATPTQGASTGADAGAWLANDPPDNTVFSPGEAFTVTRTLENVGTSTWSTYYAIEFMSGDQMGAEDIVFLPYPAEPGTNVQVSVDFVAPESPGEKRSEWSLINANGDPFYSFYVIIEVSDAADGGS